MAALVIAIIAAVLGAALWANAYFGFDRRLPFAATNDSEPAPEAVPAQSPSERPVQAPPRSSRPGGAAQPAKSPPPPQSQSTAAPPPSAPAPQAAASSSATQPPAAAASAPRATAPALDSAPPASADAAAIGQLPRSRIELAADTIDVPLTDPAARIIVRRRGSLAGAATFTWWTESGTAKPGQDFVAVTPHEETIEDGKNSVSLFIPVVGDATRQQPKSFYVVINDPGPGVTLGARTLTMVTIPPSQ
jgi:hypothetical protein